MKPPSGNWWGWLPFRWHPKAARWRRTKGPILADDGFASHLEQTKKPTPPPPPSWAERSQPREAA